MSVWVVIGASGGIGLSVLKHLAQVNSPQPHQYIALGRNQEKLEQSVSTFLNQNPLVPKTSFWTQSTDVSDFDGLQKLFEEIVSSYGRIDGVVNCAGSLFLKPAHRTRYTEWQDVVNQNLTTAFSTVRAATTVMQKQKGPEGGSIVLCSSAAARIGLANHEAIAAAKAGVEGLVRSAACTYASKGIRINAVSPGLTETPLTSTLFNSDNTLKLSQGLHPLPNPGGRLGTPDDIAKAIVWLLTQDSQWVTGQVLAVDGGLSTLKGS
jgi:NAD(P)-dependent dehydrogenase (short-subunit alcohol dehydrogenase family)